MITLTALDPTFVLSNRIEAALWSLIALVFLTTALRTQKRDAYAASIAFLAFGISDIVESHTGAWWRPWWLLVWKGLCLLMLLILIIRHTFSARRTARPRAAIPSHSPAQAQNPDPPATRSP
jgi:hypothetical protein